MIQFNTLNVKLSNSQLNKLKSAIKNGTEVTLNPSSNLIGSSNNETNFPHKLLSTNTQVSKISKAFANGSSANVKFSKTQLSKMVHPGELTGLEYTIAPIKRLLSVPQFIDNKLKNVLKTKNKISDTIKTVDSSIKGIKKISGTGIALTNNEIKGIMKVIKSLENGGILLK